MLDLLAWNPGGDLNWEQHFVNPDRIVKVYDVLRNNGRVAQYRNAEHRTITVRLRDRMIEDDLDLVAAVKIEGCDAVLYCNHGARQIAKAINLCHCLRTTMGTGFDPIKPEEA